MCYPVTSYRESHFCDLNWKGVSNKATASMLSNMKGTVLCHDPIVLNHTNSVFAALSQAFIY